LPVKEGPAVLCGGAIEGAKDSSEVENVKGRAAFRQRSMNSMEQLVWNLYKHGSTPADIGKQLFDGDTNKAKAMLDWLKGKTEVYDALGKDVTCRECGNPLTAVGPASGLCTACAAAGGEEIMPVPAGDAGAQRGLTYDHPKIVTIRKKIQALEDGGAKYDDPRVQKLEADIRRLEGNDVLPSPVPERRGKDKVLGNGAVGDFEEDEHGVVDPAQRALPEYGAWERAKKAFLAARAGNAVSRRLWNELNAAKSALVVATRKIRRAEDATTAEKQLPRPVPGAATRQRDKVLGKGAVGDVERAVAAKRGACASCGLTLRLIRAGLNAYEIPYHRLQSGKECPGSGEAPKQKSEDATPSIGKNIAGYYFKLNGETYGGYPTRAEALREYKVETTKKAKDATTSEKQLPRPVPMRPLQSAALPESRVAEVYRPRTQAELARSFGKDAGDVRIVYNRLLGGWYVVRGPHQTPLSGRFNSKEEAQASLGRRAKDGDDEDDARDAVRILKMKAEGKGVSAIVDATGYSRKFVEDVCRGVYGTTYSAILKSFKGGAQDAGLPKPVPTSDGPFQKLERSLAHKSGVTDSAALAASIGRGSLGKAEMARRSAAGRGKDDEMSRPGAPRWQPDSPNKQKLVELHNELNRKKYKHVYSGSTGKPGELTHVYGRGAGVQSRNGERAVLTERKNGEHGVTYREAQVKDDVEVRDSSTLSEYTTLLKSMGFKPDGSGGSGANRTVTFKKVVGAGRQYGPDFVSIRLFVKDGDGDASGYNNGGCEKPPVGFSSISEVRGAVARAEQIALTPRVKDAAIPAQVPQTDCVYSPTF
jgi:hypothetical protein